MKTLSRISAIAILCLLVPAMLSAQEEKAKLAIAAIQAGNNDSSAFYNAACYLALAGKTDEAFSYLKQAIERGYANVLSISFDKDLSSLRNDARWQQTINKAAAKQSEQQRAFWNQKSFWDNAALNTAYKENLSDDEKVAGWRVLGYLTDKPFKTSGWYTRQYRPTFRARNNTQEIYGEASGEYAPNGKKLYTKPVIVLTGAKTYSAAEDSMGAYVAMKRGLIVGEPTGGSTGQPMFISLPGGGQARICTKRDRFPDGTDFIGKGVQPENLCVQPSRTFAPNEIRF